MINWGDIPLNTVIPFPFDSFGTNGESLTLSGLAVTDIEVYKGTSMTQRASDNGFTLMDTDGIDIDSRTGIHGFSIDTSDNSDASFYAAGEMYWVVVDAVTINTQTVRFVIGTFRLVPATSSAGVPKVDVTHFGGTAGTFSSGRPEANTTHVAGSAISQASGVLNVNVTQISGDTTSADNLESYTDGTTPMPVNVTQISGDATAADNLESYTDGSVPMPVDLTHIFGSILSEGGAGRLATAFTTLFDVASPVLTTASVNQTGDAYSVVNDGVFGNSAINSDVDSINAKIGTISNLGSGATIGSNLVDIESQTDDIGVAGAGLTALGDTRIANLDATVSSRASQTSVNTIDDFLDTEIAAILAAVDTEVASILSLLDDARGEPGQGAPPVNPDLATKIDYLYKAWRNKKTQTSSQYSLFADDASTVDQKATVSDDGTTTTIGEVATGP